MSSGVHPFILIAACGALAALVALAIAGRAKGGVLTFMMVGLALVFLVPAGYVCLVFYPELVDGRFRTYKSFYRDIQVGMTREQVLRAMEQRYPTNGARLRPKILNDTPEGLGFFMNPEASREPNCEGIFLSLEAGRITKKEYSAD